MPRRVRLTFFALLLIGAGAAGCGSSNQVVNCMQSFSDGGCVIRALCGTTSCPAGQTQVVGPNGATHAAAQCIQDVPGC